MKTFISTGLILFIYCSTSYCQFQKEVTYPSYGVTRVLLQDQTEAYFYFDQNETEIKITNKSHEIINSIPAPPCDGTFVISSVRNDFDNISLGFLCSCRKSPSDIDPYILDQDGNIVREFINVPSMDDRYIIDVDNKDSYIYDTQSLELLSEMPQIILKQGSESYVDGNYYYGYNSIDSIFIFDSALTSVKRIEYDFEGNSNYLTVSMASILENNEISFYFLVKEPSAGFYTERVLDVDGNTVYESEIGRLRFHKYEQNLQVIILEGVYLSSYYVNDQELKEEITSRSPNSFLGTFGVGKYIAVDVDTLASRAVFYNYKRELDFPITLSEPVVYFGPFTFNDHLGKEYFWYVQRDGPNFNTVIYKEYKYLQTIFNSGYIIVSNIEGLPTKIISYSTETNLDEVYGSVVTNTKELSKSTVSLSPNPVSDALTLSATEMHEKYTIYNETGKVVKDEVISKAESIIDVSQLTPGMYSLRIHKKDSSSEIKKFIKI